MHRYLKFMLLSLSLLLVACGEPTLDSSSDEALASSISKVREQLSSQERKQFDALMAEKTIGGALASAFSKETISIASILQPYDGLTGKEFISRVEGEQAEKLALKQAEEKAKLSSLEKQLSLWESEKEKLKEIVVGGGRLFLNEGSFFDQPELFVTITNNFHIPIGKIEFTYSLNSPDRTIPWKEGEGYVIIDGGLEPKESREVKSINGGYSMGDYKVLYNAAVEHPEATLHLQTIDAFGPDGSSILKILPLDSSEESELKQLREAYSNAP